MVFIRFIFPAPCFFTDKDENDDDDDEDDGDDDEDDDDDEDNDDEGNEEEGADELGQEAKRQRLNQSPPSGEPDATEAAESSAVVWMPAQPPSWQPRRRLLRGRRGNRASGGFQEPSLGASSGSQAPPGSSGIFQNLAIPNRVPMPPISSASETSDDASNATALDTANAANNSSASSAATPSSASGATSQIPDGIDPSFLAALPEEMRDEVIAEHLRYVHLIAAIYTFNRFICIFLLRTASNECRSERACSSKRPCRMSRPSSK